MRSVDIEGFLILPAVAAILDTLPLWDGQRDSVERELLRLAKTYAELLAVYATDILVARYGRAFVLIDAEIEAVLDAGPKGKIVAEPAPAAVRRNGRVLAKIGEDVVATFHRGPDGEVITEPAPVHFRGTQVNLGGRSLLWETPGMRLPYEDWLLLRADAWGTFQRCVGKVSPGSGGLCCPVSTLVVCRL
jgi:hypothetical protein